MSKTAAIVGGGPAGLMAAEILAQAGARVTVYDAKPSMGRKFLMAGKSGLNLTMNAPLADLTAQYFEAAPRLAPIVAEFDAEAISGVGARVRATLVHRQFGAGVSRGNEGLSLVAGVVRTVGRVGRCA